MSAKSSYFTEISGVLFKSFSRLTTNKPSKLFIIHPLWWENNNDTETVSMSLCCHTQRICRNIIFSPHHGDVIMGVMASQITSLTIVYTIVYSGADQRKYQSSTSLAFVWGIHRWPVYSPHKWPVTRKMFPFDDVIMACRENLKKSDLNPVTGEFPAQRRVGRCFKVFFGLRLNKRLSKQSWGWWVETPSLSLWRHRDVMITLHIHCIRSNHIGKYLVSVAIEVGNVFISLGWSYAEYFMTHPQEIMLISFLVTE